MKAFSVYSASCQQLTFKIQYEFHHPSDEVLNLNFKHLIGRRNGNDLKNNFNEYQWGVFNSEHLAETNHEHSGVSCVCNFTWITYTVVEIPSVAFGLSLPTAILLSISERFSARVGS